MKSYKGVYIIICVRVYCVHTSLPDPRPIDYIWSEDYSRCIYNIRIYIELNGDLSPEKNIHIGTANNRITVYNNYIKKIASIHTHIHYTYNII